MRHVHNSYHHQHHGQSDHYDSYSHQARHQLSMRCSRPDPTNHQSGRELSTTSGCHGLPSTGPADAFLDSDQRHQGNSNQRGYDKHRESDGSTHDDREWHSQCLSPQPSGCLLPRRTGFTVSTQWQYSKRPTPSTESLHVGTSRPQKPIGSGKTWSLRELINLRSTTGPPGGKAGGSGGSVAAPAPRTARAIEGLGA